MKNNNQVDLEYVIWVFFLQTYNIMIKVREKELKRLGVSIQQATILSIVKTIKVPATPAEISRRILRESHTVSGMLKRIEEKGLIKKVKDLERKNQVRIVLTDKGEEVYRRSKELKFIRKVISGLPQQKQNRLMAYLRTLRDNALVELKEVKKGWIPPSITNS